MFEWLQKFFGGPPHQRRRRTFEAHRTEHPTVPLRPRHVTNPLPAMPSQGILKAAYSDLRDQALQGTPEVFGLVSPYDPAQPWGVVMESGFRDGSFTLVALSDGSASIYLSNGGGCIGGRRHETVRQAAQSMVALAARFQPQATATLTFDLPGNSHTVFYLLTASGVFTADAPDEELNEAEHTWSPLFQAGQEVINQYRVVEKQLKPRRLTPM